MNRPHRLRRSRAQRGMAALVVVMVLFFVVSLVAAYTNRNLIFEQRTAANYYRSTQIFSVAQSGADWGTAMINGSRILDNCTISANVADASFRERYLSIDPESGYITPVLQAGGGRRSAACVYNGAGWNCSCPTDADPSPTVPVGSGPFPAFRVRFATILGSTSPGMVRMEVVGCPRLDLAAGGCLDFDNAVGDEGRQYISVILGLHSGVKTTPAAPLMARDDINAPAATMQAHNADQPASGVKPSGGVAVQSGGAVSGVTIISGAPGMPTGAALVENDPSLYGLTIQAPLVNTEGERLFSNMFGLTYADYRRQPAIQVLTGCPCNAAALRTAIQMNPGRPIWVDGNLVLDSAGNIGGPTAPVVVVVDGQITSPTPVTFYGVLYSRADPWTISGTLTVNGAAVAENGMDGTGSSSFTYDPALLQRLRVTTGSFVPVASGWKDWVQ